MRAELPGWKAFLANTFPLTIAAWIVFAIVQECAGKHRCVVQEQLEQRRPFLKQAKRKFMFGHCAELGGQARADDRSELFWRKKLEVLQQRDYMGLVQRNAVVDLPRR
jgi:hypothetical protein